MRIEMEMMIEMGEELMNERRKKDEGPANKGRGWPREAVITYASSRQAAQPLGSSPGKLNPKPLRNLA